MTRLDRRLAVIAGGLLLVLIVLLAVHALTGIL